MSNNVLLGKGNQMISVPQSHWEEHLQAIPEHGGERLAFMLKAHHRVRYFVVRELTRRGKALEPRYISATLGMEISGTVALLEELERQMFFLVRDEEGAVTWAYPVTVEQTPHRLTFDSGEQIYAAWGEDAIAAPFVQGRLERRYLEVEVATSCAHCGREMHIDIDSELDYRVREKGARPLVFEPSVDWATYDRPTIIDGY